MHSKAALRRAEEARASNVSLYPSMPASSTPLPLLGQATEYLALTPQSGSPESSNTATAHLPHTTHTAGLSHRVRDIPPAIIHSSHYQSLPKRTSSLGRTEQLHLPPTTPLILPSPSQLAHCRSFEGGYLRAPLSAQLRYSKPGAHGKHVSDQG